MMIFTNIGIGVLLLYFPMEENCIHDFESPSRTTQNLLLARSVTNSAVAILTVIFREYFNGIVEFNNVTEPLLLDYFDSS